MQKMILWGIVVIIVIAGGLLIWGARDSAMTPSATDGGMTAGQTGTPAMQDQDSPSAGAPVVATFDGASFSPATITVKRGAAVTWKSTAGDMWVATAPHPAHTAYDGTTLEQHCVASYSGAASFDQCSAGTEYSYTFNNAGTWKYHNHIKTGAFGTVVVE